MKNDIVTYNAVPVIEKGKGYSAPSVQPAVFQNNAPVQSMGAVDQRGALAVTRNGLPNDITIRFDNSASGTDRQFVFGDASGLIAALLGVTFVKPSAPASNIDGVVNTIARNPVTIRSLNYRITTGTSAQFSNKLQFADADFDGSLQLIPVNIPAAQRNTQQNDKILTLAQDIPMDDTTGMILTVGAGVVVEWDLSFGAIYRSGGNF
jgi:hypothetical protein